MTDLAARLEELARVLMSAMNEAQFSSALAVRVKAPAALHNALIEAAAALRSQWEGSWLPIETAPKDGTVILVPCENWGVETVSWKTWHATGGPGWYGRANHHRKRPTHWRPRPPAPAQETRE